jgi:hypothetical protein
MSGKAIKYEPEHLQPVKVEHVADCSDCGKPDVLNRTVCFTLVDKPHTHWREKCINCKRYKHPVSGEWLEITAVSLGRQLLQEKSKSKVKN